MNPKQLAALKDVEEAGKALKSGDRNTARRLAAQAAGLAPELEEVWLMMAALASPRASLEYLRKALQINPDSWRAQKGLAWARESLRKEQAGQAGSPLPSIPPVPDEARPRDAAAEARAVRQPAPAAEPLVDAPVAQPAGPGTAVPRPKLRAMAPAKTKQAKKPRKRNPLFYLLIPLLLLLCLAGAAFVANQVSPVSALFGLATADYSSPLAKVTPATASGAAQALIDLAVTAGPQAPAGLMASASPTANLVTATPTATASVTASATASPAPTETAGATVTSTATGTATLPPTEAPTDEGPSPTPLPTDTPEPLPPTQAAYAPQPTAEGSSRSSTASSAGGKHWIDVDLTNQMVYAYEGDTLVNSFLVSTGAQPRLTVTGSYHVYERHVKGNMWGPGYFLPDVPYIMYFYKGYALHGTYWHSNFGTPMSHGCVNLSIPDAEWLYYWSTLGTLVKVHY